VITPNSTYSTQIDSSHASKQTSKIEIGTATFTTTRTRLQDQLLPLPDQPASRRKRKGETGCHSVRGGAADLLGVAGDREQLPSCQLNFVHLNVGDGAVQPITPVDQAEKAVK